MAVQRYISSSFWSDDWVDSLNVKEKLVYLYLLTNDNTSICGVYKLTIKRIKDDTSISRQEITDILQKFADDKKAYYVDEYIVLPNWLKHQHLNNESVRLGTMRALKALPDHIIAFLRKPEHFYYDIDVLFGIKKEVYQSRSAANIGTSTSKQTVQESKRALQNTAGTASVSTTPAQKTIVQHDTSTPAPHHQQEAAPPNLMGAATQHPLNPSKSAHDFDLDYDLERDSLKSLDISTHLERGEICENQQAADKPPPLSKKQTFEKKSSRFIKPTIEEIVEYCRSRNNVVDPVAFFDFYESKNWYVGKNKMTNWKAAVHTWENRQKQYSRAPPTGGAPNYKQQNFNASSLPELFKQSRLEKPPDETAALEDVLF